MAKFDVVTIGGVVRDFTFYTNKGKIIDTPEDLTAQRMLAFEYGAKINVNEAYQTLGGGAANTAASFARLGFKTAIVVKVGKDDIGKDIILKFKKEKINTNFIQTDPELMTGFSFILSADKKEREHIAFLHRGANEKLVFPTPKLKQLRSSWFYITSLSGPAWLKSLNGIFNLAFPRNIKIAWNPGNLQLQAGKKVISNLLKKTNVLILNKDEAIELVLSGMKVGRRNPRYLNQPLYLLNILNDWGPKIVVITDGKKGAWAYDGKKIYYQKIRKAKIINTVGVGDAFGSSFVAGLIKNKGDIKAALNWGMINSASILEHVGAQTGLLGIKDLQEKL